MKHQIDSIVIDQLNRPRVLSVQVFQQRGGQCFEIFQALPQGGHRDSDHIEPKKEITSQLSALDCFFRHPVSGGEDAHRDLDLGHTS
jgi:hypothetical protein